MASGVLRDGDSTTCLVFTRHNVTSQPRITARMCIATLRAPRVPRRCGAPLRHTTSRPGWARGHVTYVQNVMRHCTITKLMHNMMLCSIEPDRTSKCTRMSDGIDGGHYEGVPGTSKAAHIGKRLRLVVCE